MPVVFLTARDATEDKITGLTLGGDDYVTKPFSLEEVIARIRAVLRRVQPASGVATERPASLTFADIELDDDTHEVWKAGELVSLSPTEFKLLRYFMQNLDRVLSKAQILDHVWNYDFGGDANVVESYVSYLRRKIDTTEPAAAAHAARSGVRPAAAARHERAVTTASVAAAGDDEGRPRPRRFRWLRALSGRTPSSGQAGRLGLAARPLSDSSSPARPPRPTFGRT